MADHLSHKLGVLGEILGSGHSSRENHDILRAGPEDLASVELVTVPVSDHRNPVGAFHGPVVGDRYCLDIYPGSPENIHCGKGLYLLEALSEK